MKAPRHRSAPASIRNLFSRAVRGRGPVTTVKRRQIPHWQERGWIQKGNTYEGSYKHPARAFWGHIVEHRGGHLKFLLYDASEQIRRHSHWTCLVHRSNDWYLVHMGKPPKDMSSGILTIERLITEAYETEASSGTFVGDGKH